MEIYANEASANLDGAINSSVTSIVVKNAVNIPATGTFRARVDTEYMKIVSVSGSTWTVVRGDGGTTAAPHSDNANVVVVVTSQALDALVSVQSAGTEVSNRRIIDFASGATVSDDGTRAVVSINLPASSEAPLITPTLTGWTWINQGIATATAGANGIYLRSLNSGANAEQLHLLSTPVPATPWAATFKTSCYLRGNNFSAGACFIGSGGQISPICLNTTPSGAFLGFRWTNPTTYAGSNDFNVPILPGVVYPWYRLEDDGTNRKYSVSVDGINWHQIFSIARTTFLTADRVGLFCNPASASGGDAGILLSSFSF